MTDSLDPAGRLYRLLHHCREHGGNQQLAAQWAEYRMYARFRGEKPFISGNSARRSVTSRPMTLLPTLHRPGVAGSLRRSPSTEG